MSKVQPHTSRPETKDEKIARLEVENALLRSKLAQVSYVDTASGAFRPDEIERARNGGYQGGT